MYLLIQQQVFLFKITGTGANATTLGHGLGATPESNN